ncbi:MAG: methyltransferase domain-containing protein [Anaerolineae bacterium]|nr:methyltransferase domain-containing protein [Anaerolineae bacterium]
MVKRKSFLQSAWDFIGIPFRLVLFDQKWLPYLHWTTLEEERLNAVLPHIKGRLLDIGAGPNTLVNIYPGEGYGVDVFDWGGGTLVVEDTAHLPFEPHSFDTVTFVACLNHIPNRQEVLYEAARLLKPDGRVVITMIDPILGGFGHRIWWYSEDKKRGGMREGELGGMWTKHIVELCQNAGFRLTTHTRFVYGMNNLYIFEPM